MGANKNKKDVARGTCSLSVRVVIVSFRGCRCVLMCVWVCAVLVLLCAYACACACLLNHMFLGASRTGARVALGTASCRMTSSAPVPPVQEQACTL